MIARRSENLLVIEGQRSRTSRRMPPSVRRIITGLHRCLTFDDRSKRDAHRVASRISSRITKRCDLFEADAGQTRLFDELSRRGIFERFVLVHKSARQRPFVFEWLAASLDQQDLEPPSILS